MPRRISVERQSNLIRDLVNAEHDVVALAQAHNLSPMELASWASAASNQRTLQGLCVLADTQTQLLLSRYRLLAASRLIRLATQEDAGATAEVSRKASVDLLRLDLKRADAATGDEIGGEPGTDTAALRALIYNDTDTTDNTHT